MGCFLCVYFTGEGGGVFFVCVFQFLERGVGCFLCVFYWREGWGVLCVCVFQFLERGGVREEGRVGGGVSVCRCVCVCQCERVA